MRNHVRELAAIAQDANEKEMLAGIGAGGQRLYVVPELDLVVAVNSAHYRNPLQNIIPAGILNRVVLPAGKD